LKGVGQFGPNFQVEGTSLINHSSCRKTRCIDLSYGVRLLAKAFVMSQCTRLTDRRTNGRTDRFW